MKIFQPRNPSVQPRLNKKGKARNRDQQCERGRRRAKWHLEEKGGEIKGQFPKCHGHLNGHLWTQQITGLIQALDVKQLEVAFVTHLYKP